MITEQVIDALYKQYKKLPPDPFELDMPLLFDNGLNQLHHLNVNEDFDLIIGSIAEMSPFHCIPLKRVHAIVAFEEWIAIVLHASIVFLSKKNSKSYVHLKAIRQSFGEKLSSIFRKEELPEID